MAAAFRTVATLGFAALLFAGCSDDSSDTGATTAAPTSDTAADEDAADSGEAEEAAGALVEAASDPQREVREEAARALKRVRVSSPPQASEPAQKP